MVVRAPSQICMSPETGTTERGTPWDTTCPRHWPGEFLAFAMV